MKKTWILVANAERARCFERHGADHSLTELADFVQPKTNLEIDAHGSDLTGAAGKGHGRTGHAGTQFEPRTEVHAKDRANFSRQLADYLNQAVAEQRCDALVLIASSPMLGELKPALSGAADKLLQSSIASDLTRYQGADLMARIDLVL